MSLRRSVSALFRSNDRRFVGLLIDQARLAVSSLLLLEEAGHDGEATTRLRAEIKANERAGDELRRILIDELEQTYATPFDREDLFELSRAIDDILNAANETIVELCLYGVSDPPDFSEMARTLADGARHIQAAVTELLDHPRVASEHAVRAKRSETSMDAQYHHAISRILDGSGRDVFEVLKLRELYRHLKNSADHIDQAADKVSVIVIKQS